jgi:hypothetical protein
MTLERELIDIFAATPFQRNREILIGYYGWKDGQEHTLTEIGDRFGITRERVRQICAKLTKRHSPASLAAPVMDRVLALISERLPCPAAQFEAELVEKKLTTIGMSIENIAVGARLLGRPVRFKTVNVQPGRRTKEKGRSHKLDLSLVSDGRLVVQSDQAAAVMTAVDLVKKEIYFHGVATVEQIQQAISTRFGDRASMDLVRQVVLLIDGFCWLDEPSGWFRLQPVQRHGLPKAIDKALAVAGAVTVGQLHTALARNRRLWKEPPPENVLLEFCRQMPEVRIEGDRIISDPPRDWKKELTGVEAKLVGILKDHGPVMERGAMEDLCVGDGMNRFSFHAFVSWSPVIAQFGHSVYGLLGTEVADGQVKKLLNQRRIARANHRVLDQHGRTEDGRVWLSYRLSKAASTYAVITIPAALKKVVRGRFQFVDPDGHEIGTLATKDGRAWGLGAFLRKQGAQIGDHIVLTLDLKKRTAVVTWDEREENEA